ncbi:UDP-N-acetyl glucosamine 2-epimerase, partial [Erwinia amylovora]|nr:UDP-N-acetyl glucosamine 2-epimerase [Erwinia amylovora]
MQLIYYKGKRLRDKNCLKASNGAENDFRYAQLVHQESNHYTPTASTQQKLLRENEPAERIFFTCNTVIDSQFLVRYRELSD